MESQNPLTGWKPLGTPMENGGHTNKPIVEWHHLVTPEDKKRQALISNYAKAEVNSTNELQLRFAKAIAELIIERCTSKDEIRAIDISANDLNVTLAFCQDVIDIQKEKNISPKVIKVWANDLSYKDTSGFETELAKRAERSRQTSGEAGEIIQSPLIGKEAGEVTVDDVGNRELDIIWDRLGAMWHLLGENDLEMAKTLLDRYGNLLKKGGLLIFDGKAPGTGIGFDTETKLHLLLADNNLDEAWYSALGFSVTQEKRDNQHLMILKKL